MGDNVAPFQASNMNDDLVACQIKDGTPRITFIRMAAFYLEVRIREGLVKAV